MPKRSSALLRAMPWLLSMPIVAGCATSSPPSLPVVSKQPTIPSAPVVKEPLPSGTYWTRHCTLMLSAQQKLKTSLPGSERCGQPGQPAQ